MSPCWNCVSCNIRNVRTALPLSRFFHVFHMPFLLYTPSVCYVFVKRFIGYSFCYTLVRHEVGRFWALVSVHIFVSLLYTSFWSVCLSYSYSHTWFLLCLPCTIFRYFLWYGQKWKQKLMDKFLLHIPFGAYEKIYTYNPHTNVRNKSLLHTVLIQGLSLYAAFMYTPAKNACVSTKYIWYIICVHAFTHILWFVFICDGRWGEGGREISRYNIILDGCMHA